MIDPHDLLLGTADQPCTLEHPEQNQQFLAALHHVHDDNDVCVKNRFGPRCATWDRQAHVDLTLRFVRDFLGLELLPWQEDFIRAAVTGKHMFEHKIRHVNGGFLPETYGLFASAKDRVDSAVGHSFEWEILSRPAFPFRSIKP